MQSMFGKQITRAFGLQSSERDFEISFIISNGLPSIKMPLLLEYKGIWKSEHLLLEALFLPRLVALVARSSTSHSSLRLPPPRGATMKRKLQWAKLFYQLDSSRHIHRDESWQPLRINIVICSQWDRFFHHLQSRTKIRPGDAWGGADLSIIIYRSDKSTRRKEIFNSKLGGSVVRQVESPGVYNKSHTHSA